jgi:hypothetical protein
MITDHQTVLHRYATESTRGRKIFCCKYCIADRKLFVLQLQVCSRDALWSRVYSRRSVSPLPVACNSLLSGHGPSAQAKLDAFDTDDALRSELRAVVRSFRVEQKAAA